MKNDITNINAKIDAKINIVNNNVENIKNDVKTINNQVTNIKNDVTSIKSDVTSVNAKVENNIKIINGIQTDVDVYKRQPIWYLCGTHGRYRFAAL